MFSGPAIASTLGGMVAGTALADALAAVPTKTAIPATTGAAVAKTTADGTPVSGNVTPRQTVFIAAGYVVLAIVVLLGGARVFRDARIG